MAVYSRLVTRKVRCERRECNGLRRALLQRSGTFDWGGGSQSIRLTQNTVKQGREALRTSYRMLKIAGRLATHAVASLERQDALALVMGSAVGAAEEAE